MYADDLVIVVDNRNELKRCIQVIKTWDKRLGMKMNEKKSAILHMSWKRIDDEAGLMFEGIKILDKYKFLGAHINRMLDLDDYIKYVNAKVCFVTSRMAKVRNLRRIKLNINLFKVFIGPWVRMGALNVLFGGSTGRKAYLRAVRKWFRDFCLIPSKSSNQVVRWLLCDLEVMF